MLKFLLRLVVSIALLSLVLSRVDAGAMGQALAGAKVYLVGLALVLSLAMAAAEAAQWQSVLAALDHRISYTTALLYSLVGTFFGNFAPSGMGVDIYRAAQMRMVGISIAAAVRAVLATRLMAFVALLLVIASGLPIVFSYALAVRDQFLFGFAFAGGFAALLGVLVVVPVQNRVPFLRRSSFVSKIAHVSKDLIRVLSSPVRVPGSLFYSILPHLLRISIFAALAAALNADIAFAALYSLLPMALLVAMIPVTLASWGIREISVVYFLSLAGVPANVALGLSITFGISRLVMAAIGGAVWVFARSHHYQIQSTGQPD